MSIEAIVVVTRHIFGEQSQKYECLSQHICCRNDRDIAIFDLQEMVTKARCSCCLTGGNGAGVFCLDLEQQEQNCCNSLFSLFTKY